MCSTYLASSQAPSMKNRHNSCENNHSPCAGIFDRRYHFILARPIKACSIVIRPLRRVQDYCQTVSSLGPFDSLIHLSYSSKPALRSLSSYHRHESMSSQLQPRATVKRSRSDLSRSTTPNLNDSDISIEELRNSLPPFLRQSLSGEFIFVEIFHLRR